MFKVRCRVVVEQLNGCCLIENVCFEEFIKFTNQIDGCRLCKNLNSIKLIR